MNKKIIPLFLIIVVLGTVIFFSGCGNKKPNPKSGSYCTIQIRRDWLGVSRDMPLSITTDGINGAQLSFSGKLKNVTDEWVVAIDQNKHEYWIAREAILSIRISK
jgi:hypothetical protein